MGSAWMACSSAMLVAYVLIDLVVFMRVKVNGSGGQFQSFAFANFTITVPYQKKPGIDCRFHDFFERCFQGNKSN